MSEELTLAEEIQRIKDDVLLLELKTAVLVEGKSDVDFWQNTLNRVIPEQFKIFPYVNFPKAETSGKSALTTHFAPFAAQDFILCVDSDYDYLLENPDLQRPFIFQTYVYAVENYQCYPPNLKNVLQKRFDTEGVSDFDFEDFIRRYSQVIHRLLVYSLYSVKTKNKNNQFTASDCGQAASFNQGENVVTNLSNLAERVDNQCVIHADKYEGLTEFQDFKRRIEVLGLTETSAYLFFRGHNLLENVVVKLLENVGLPIRYVEFERRLNLENGHQIAADYDNLLKQNSFEKLLANHTAFMESPFFQKIESDILTAFSQN